MVTQNQVNLKLSAYQVGDRIKPRFVWGVGFPSAFVDQIPEDMRRVKLAAKDGQLLVNFGEEGVRITKHHPRAKISWTTQIGSHHVNGISTPDDVVKSLKVHGEWEPDSSRIRVDKVPDIVKRAIEAVHTPPKSEEEQFPATHFTEDVHQAVANAATGASAFMPQNDNGDDDSVTPLGKWLDHCIQRSQLHPFTETVNLTPALAAELLERNPGNRPVRPAKLNQYISDIESDRWEFNGETIIMSKEGLMNNGQHRCLAVIETGKSITTFLAFGLTRESRKTVDTGASRGAHDHLAVEGYSQPTTLSAATRFVITYERNEGRNLSYLNRVTSAEIFERATNDSLLEEASHYPYSFHANKAKRLAPPSVMAFCYYVFSKKNPEDAKRFLNQVVTGLGLTASDPAYLTREKLLELSSLRREQKIEVLIRGWNAFRQGKTIKSMRIQWMLPNII